MAATAMSTGEIFTASGVPLPERGRWRITATSMDQWGCFDVVV
jgi:hypothetical protein